MLKSQLDLLVISAQRGNKAAFTELIKHFHQPLLHYAIRLCGEHELAQDAVQETWISTTKKLRKLNDPKAFQCWLYKTLKWRITDAVRKKPQTDAITFDITSQATEVNNDDLSVFIAKLPLIEQEVIHLFYLAEFKIKDIADIQNVPTGTVKSRLNRARKQLQAIYKEEE